MSSFTGTENYEEIVRLEIQKIRVADTVSGEHGVPASNNYHTKHDTRDIRDPTKPFDDYLVDTTVREIVLNVYELPHHKEWNKWTEFGLYHTTIEVIALTAPNHVNNTWSKSLVPTSNSPSLGYIFKYSKKDGFKKLAHYDTEDPLIEKISLGRHEGNYSQIIAHIREVANEGGFEAENYDDVKKNSNHFCDAVSRRLLNKGIPLWINRATLLGPVDFNVPPPPAYLDFLRDITKDGIMPLIEIAQIHNLANESINLFNKKELDIRNDLELEQQKFKNLPVLRHGDIITDLKEYQSVAKTEKEKDDDLGKPMAVKLFSAGATLTGIPSLFKLGSSIADLCQCQPAPSVDKNNNLDDNPWAPHYKIGDEIHPDILNQKRQEIFDEVSMALKS